MCHFFVIFYNCRDGGAVSGLFLALWLLCDKITDEQEVDIFHTVKQIQESRPQLVTSLVILLL